MENLASSLLASKCGGCLCWIEHCWKPWETILV